MTKQDKDILLCLNNYSLSNQRMIADKSGYSVGSVNKSISKLLENELIDEKYHLTEKAEEYLHDNKPKSAVLLAAGLGMRMVPINVHTPKALLEIKGEKLIEHTIKQLHEAGIKDIKIVVGYMKDRFEYLIDKYDVQLIFNDRYSIFNNWYSLWLARNEIYGTYIVPCDIWCYENPFSDTELYSWYMVTDSTTEDSTVRVGRKGKLITDNDEGQGNRMVGISYISKEDSLEFVLYLDEMKRKKRGNAFWEELLSEDHKYEMFAKVVRDDYFVEINTYEQLRELDSDSHHLQTDAISIICDSLGVNAGEISDIRMLKKGMTNRSFLFKCQDKSYIMRIPGVGTDNLINRKEEADVYKVLSGKGICDNVVYINPENGYKITEFIENARVCDSNSEDDLIKCMEKLRAFHNSGLKVNHEFDIFGKIDYYELLWDGNESIFIDYKETKTKVYSLKDYIEKNVQRKCLTHIDAVPDNFLIYDDAGEERISLIDWEYAGMQDPDVDIAMFCIYALYDKEKVDSLIDIYYEGCCPSETRTKIYCYIAACGLLWSNWCEYKRICGVEFGEYSLAQYRYAKTYYKVVRDMLRGESDE